MRHIAYILLVSISFVLPVSAQTGLVDRYISALSMDEVFEILRQEGVAAGEDMAREGADLSASPAWSARLSGIYQIQRMEQIFRAQIGAVGDLELSTPAIEFFETELGQRIVSLELAARRAMADEATEQAMARQVSEMRQNASDRIALYEEFIEVNDLVESNVSGALNSNLSFYRGMATLEQFRITLNEGFMLSTVWEQEPEIRKDTQDWVLNFSALAYDVLSDEEMQQYIDLSNSEAGQKLNAALFAGFDKVFELQSYDLGQATGEFSIGEDT